MSPIPVGQESVLSYSDVQRKLHRSPQNLQLLKALIITKVTKSPCYFVVCSYCPMQSKWVQQGLGGSPAARLQGLPVYTRGVRGTSTMRIYYLDATDTRPLTLSQTWR